VETFHDVVPSVPDGERISVRHQEHSGKGQIVFHVSTRNALSAMIDLLRRLKSGVASSLDVETHPRFQVSGQSRLRLQFIEKGRSQIRRTSRDCYVWFGESDEWQTAIELAESLFDDFGQQQLSIS
jgi:hypothetical protein